MICKRFCKNVIKSLHNFHIWRFWWISICLGLKFQREYGIATCTCAILWILGNKISIIFNNLPRESACVTHEHRTISLDFETPRLILRHHFDVLSVAPVFSFNHTLCGHSLSSVFFYTINAPSLCLNHAFGSIFLFLFYLPFCHVILSWEYSTFHGFSTRR